MAITKLVRRIVNLKRRQQHFCHTRNITYVVDPNAIYRAFSTVHTVGLARLGMLRRSAPSARTFCLAQCGRVGPSELALQQRRGASPAWARKGLGVGTLAEQIARQLRERQSPLHGPTTSR